LQAARHAALATGSGAKHFPACEGIAGSKGTLRGRRKELKEQNNHTST